MASEHQSRTVVAIILPRSVSRIAHSLLHCLYSWCTRGHIKTYEHMHRAESNRLRDMAERRGSHQHVGLSVSKRRRRDLAECPRQHSQNWKTSRNLVERRQPLRPIDLSEDTFRSHPSVATSTSAVDTELRSVYFRELRGGCCLYTALYTAGVPEGCGQFWGWRPSGDGPLAVRALWCMAPPRCTLQVLATTCVKPQKRRVGGWGLKRVLQTRPRIPFHFSLFCGVATATSATS